MKMLCWGSWRGRGQSEKAEMWEETEWRELEPEVALGGERAENSGPGSVSCRRAPKGSNGLFSSLICADTAWDLGQDPTVYGSEDGLLWTLGSHFWHDFQMPDSNDAHVSDVLSPLAWFFGSASCCDKEDIFFIWMPHFCQFCESLPWHSQMLIFIL